MDNIAKNIQQIIGVDKEKYMQNIKKEFDQFHNFNTTRFIPIYVKVLIVVCYTYQIDITIVTKYYSDLIADYIKLYASNSKIKYLYLEKKSSQSDDIFININSTTKKAKQVLEISLTNKIIQNNILEYLDENLLQYDYERKELKKFINLKIKEYHG